MSLSLSNIFPDRYAAFVDKNTLISFDITSSEPADFLYNIVIKMDYGLTIIYSDSGFVAPFDGPNSSVTDIVGGYHFVINKTSPYAGTVLIGIQANDFSFGDGWNLYINGNINVFNQSPLPDATDILETTLISFDLVADNPLVFEEVIVSIDSTTVYDGVNFLPPFDGERSSIVSNYDGYTIVIDNTFVFSSDSLVSIGVESGDFYGSWSFRTRLLEINILNKSPLPETILVDENTLISFDVISDTQLLLDYIGASVNGSNVFNVLTEIAFGPTVSFTKPDYGTTQDNISAAVHIKRNNSKGIYNSVLESSYDDEDYTSPLDTEWTYYDVPWGDLRNIKDREYFSWAEAVNFYPPDNMIGAEMVMHIISEDRYFKVIFSSWTSGGLGGGFSYERTEIFLSTIAVFLPPFNGVNSSVDTISNGYNITIDKTTAYSVGSVSIMANAYSTEDEWNFFIGIVCVSNKLPAPHLTQVDANTLISFDLTSDFAINLDQVNIYIEGLLGYDGTDFITPFDGTGSNIISILDGYSFTINKTSPYDNKEILITARVYSFEDNWSFYVGGTTINVTNKFPLANARGISEDALVCFDVVSYAGLALSAIKIYIDNKIIYDDGFIAPFNGPSSNVSAISDGYHFIIDNTLPYDNFVSLRINYGI